MERTGIHPEGDVPGATVVAESAVASLMVNGGSPGGRGGDTACVSLRSKDRIRHWMWAREAPAIVTG